MRKSICALRFMLLLGMAILLFSACAESTPSGSDASYEIVEASEYYSVEKTDGLYFCHFYNRAHETVKTEGPLSKEPAVTTVDGWLIRFTTQAGTGLGTQCGYYYNPEQDIFSETFSCILDEYNGMVAYATQDAIVVQNIFSQEEILRIDSFEAAFSPMADPIQSATFLKDGKAISFTYLSGSDYQQIAEEVSLPVQ